MDEWMDEFCWMRICMWQCGRFWKDADTDSDSLFSIGGCCIFSVVLWSVSSHLMSVANISLLCWCVSTTFLTFQTQSKGIYLQHLFTATIHNTLNAVYLLMMSTNTHKKWQCIEVKYVKKDEISLCQLTNSCLMIILI